MKRIPATTADVACTLTSEDLKDVSDAWQRLFRSSLVSRDPVPGGLRLAFRPGCEEALAHLVDIESDCCRWINFQLDGPILTLTAVGEGEQAIRATWVFDPNPEPV